MGRAARTAPDVGDVTRRLRRYERELRARGIDHVSIFGSVARGEARPGSDVDLLVDISPDAALDLLALVALERRVGEIVGRRVGLSERSALAPVVARRADADEIHVF